MEGQSILCEDISARMMRRAKCFHASRYSTDAKDNVLMLEEEKEQIMAQEHLHLSQSSSSSLLQSYDFNQIITNIDQLLHCWRWIALVEHLSMQRGSASIDDVSDWLAEGLIDAGVMTLMKMSIRDAEDDKGNTWMDTKTTSESLHCDVYDSPMRRAALNACGWIKNSYGILQDLLDECEGRGEFERSAALAVWHGDLTSCVSALQRGAEDVRLLVEEGDASGSGHCGSYAETLNLMAMIVSGFSVTKTNDGVIKTTDLWNTGCDDLLRRLDKVIAPDVDSVQLPGTCYLCAVLLFLKNIGNDADFNKTIYNHGLSLADRVGFAIKFLPRASLYSFLEELVQKCVDTGNLEGLLITGLNENGISLVQAYMDRYSDMQTAALITSRVVLPMKWSSGQSSSSERRVCSEWLESYRLFLNGLQMWNSRAAFDVGRFEHLRQIQQGGGGTNPRATKKQQSKSQANNNNFPPQLWARCNYCNASLPLSKLRRQEGIANSWLSRQKPVLSCCPQCKKPLPRCSICLLSLGCLNP